MHPPTSAIELITALHQSSQSRNSNWTQTTQTNLAFVQHVLGTTRIIERVKVYSVDALLSWNFTIDQIVC